MDLNSLKEAIKIIPNDDHLYLIEKTTSDTGFFLFKGNLLYLVKDYCEKKIDSIETDFLRLQVHINIVAVKNDSSFESGFYNMIEYKGTLSDENIVSFIKLCSIYANNIDEVEFKEFFYSLVSLFQLSGKENYKKAEGLYGELKYMQWIEQKFGIDISMFWHKKGPFSRFDFSAEHINLEVKTCCHEEKTIFLKHSQVFGTQHCYIAVVECEESEGGETIEQLVESITEHPTKFYNVSFRINLEKELYRVLSTDVTNIKFSLKDIKLFDSLKVNPFSEIPERVSNISYKFDYTELNSLSEQEQQRVYENFKK